MMERAITATGIKKPIFPKTYIKGPWNEKWNSTESNPGCSINECKMPLYKTKYSYWLTSDDAKKRFRVTNWDQFYASAEKSERHWEL